MKHWSDLKLITILHCFIICFLYSPFIFHAWNSRKRLHFFFLFLSRLVVFNQIKLNDILSSWSYKYRKRLLHEFLLQWLTVPLLSYDSPIRAPLGNFIISLWLYVLRTIWLFHDIQIVTTTKKKLYSLHFTTSFKVVIEIQRVQLPHFCTQDFSLTSYLLINTF